jgi:cytochrome b
VSSPALTGPETAQLRESHAAQPASPTIAVWDAPLRAWHWSLALCVIVACITPNRFDTLHRVAGYAVIVLLVFRLVWGFAGTRYSRFRGLPRKLRQAPRYLVGLLRGRGGRYLGLNPAGALMLAASLVLLAISAVTGAMQVTVAFFGVWWVEDTHAWTSNLIIALAVLHVLGVIAMSLRLRENLTRAMITGRKRRRFS